MYPIEMDSSEARMFLELCCPLVNTLPENSNGDLAPAVTVYSLTLGLASMISVFLTPLIDAISVP